MRSPIIFIILIFCFLGGHIYLARRISAWGELSPRGKKIVNFIIGSIFLGEAGGIVSMRFIFQQFRSLPIFSMLVFGLIGVTCTLIFYFFATDLWLIAWKIAKRPPKSESQFSSGRRRLFTLGALGLGSTAIGFWQASDGPTIKKVDIFIEDLPPSFDGYKIAQISDLHIGPIIDKIYTEKVVALTMALNADLIALTGDIVDGPFESTQPDALPLKQLHAPDGCFYITGNHEYYWGVEAWLKEFSAMGFTLLLNEHRVLTRGKDELVIAGVNDLNASRHLASHESSPEKALLGAPSSAKKIMLAHQPQSYLACEAAGTDVQLSGHTHGGQFFPFNLAVALEQPFYRGLNKFNKMQIYTSCGTGYWGPPTRFAVPSEITLIQLRRKS